MIRLIRSELLKLRTTQVWFWLLLGCVAISALLVIGPMASNNVNSSDDIYRMFVGSVIGYTYILVYVVGVLGITTETRYQTITPTVLVTPSRARLVLGKLVAYALIGAGYALTCVAVQAAIAFPWLAAKGIDVNFGHNHIGRALVSVFGILAVFGVIGVGIGALLRNQIVAVTVGIVFLLIAQQLLLIIPGVKHAYPYTPGAAVFSVVIPGNEDRSFGDGVHLLPVWGGVVLLLLYALVPAFFGAAYSLRRDIT